MKTNEIIASIATAIKYREGIELSKIDDYYYSKLQYNFQEFLEDFGELYYFNINKKSEYFQNILSFIGDNYLNFSIFKGVNGDFLITYQDKFILDYYPDTPSNLSELVDYIKTISYRKTKIDFGEKF